MSQLAKLFMNGRSQAVRLPAAFRFEGAAVFIRRDDKTGDVILSRKPGDWRSFFTLVDQADIPSDFMADRRDSPPAARDLF